MSLYAGFFSGFSGGGMVGVFAWFDASAGQVRSGVGLGRAGEDQKLYFVCRRA